MAVKFVSNVWKYRPPPPFFQFPSSSSSSSFVVISTFFFHNQLIQSFPRFAPPGVFFFTRHTPSIHPNSVRLFHTPVEDGERGRGGYRDVYRLRNRISFSRPTDQNVLFFRRVQQPAVT